jgi:lipopolysaccharide transport system permease protein
MKAELPMIAYNSFDPVKAAWQPWRALTILHEYRFLIIRLVSREVQGRYRDSLLGLFWALINPILMLAVYAFVFIFVLKARWPTQVSEGPAVATLYLFSGLIQFNLFAENINRAPGLLLENLAYIKKLVFPLEILPWVSFFAALVNFSISFGIFFIFYFFAIGIPPVSALFLPVLLMPFVLLILGASWFLAAVGLFLRDLRQIVGVTTSALMFSSPIFYPVSVVPEAIRFFVNLNPLTFPIEASKDLLFQGSFHRYPGLLIYSLIAVACAGFGYWVFMRMRRAFSDVV